MPAMVMASYDDGQSTKQDRLTTPSSGALILIQLIEAERRIYASVN